jgi:T5SS/PEP-CTERM-associated repeat protein
MSRFAAVRAAMAARSMPFCVAVLAALSISFAAPPSARATVTRSGDYDPTGAWNIGTTVHIGNTASGTVTVNGGSGLSTGISHIGYTSTGLGLVNITGSGSSWETSTIYVGNSGGGTLSIAAGGDVTGFQCTVGNALGSTGILSVDGNNSDYGTSQDITVGNYGGGTLSITNGGHVTTNNRLYVGMYPTSSAAIDFGTAGGTLTANTLLASPSQLSGTGTVIAKGLVTDTNLVFNTADDLNRTITFDASGQNVAVKLDMKNSPSNNGALGAGWRGTGSLTIGGATVQSNNGYLGGVQGSSGSATVSGTASNWNISGSTGNGVLYVGYRGAGALSINGGGHVNSTIGYIGAEATATGVANIDGSDSNWTANTIAVGQHGSGTLSITGGATVTVTNQFGIGVFPSGTGAVDFGAGGGTITAKSLFALPNQFTGAGTVVARGLVTDMNLEFHTPADLTRNYTWGQNVAVTIDMADGTSTNGSLGVGYRGAGSLLIQGTTVSSDAGYLGISTGSTGVATVMGANSLWNIPVSTGTAPNLLTVGIYGAGTLSLLGGGSVTGDGVSIADQAGSTGLVSVAGSGSTLTVRSFMVGSGGDGKVCVTGGGHLNTTSGSFGISAGSTGAIHVDGTGSTWTCTPYNITLGYYGAATASFTGGAAVSVAAGTATGKVIVNNGSLLAIDVGRGTSLTISGTAPTLTNNGTLRILAGASVPVAGSYTPVSAGTWGGTGTCQPIGGKWNASTHVFTPSDITLGTAGSAVPLELSAIERALINGSGPNGNAWNVGVGFPSMANETDITLVATPVLQSIIGGQSVLGAWTFSTTGYDVTPANPIYLSFDVGNAYPLEKLAVWHYDGSTWTSCTPLDLTYDGHYASFTATGLSGYALTAVPEPGMLVLLAAGLLGVLGCAWRKQRAG